MATWKGLKKNIEALLVENINLQIHATAYTWPGKCEVNIGRHWIALDKKIIWDFPKDFLSWLKPELENPVIYLDGEIGVIADILREYVNAPLEGLIDKNFPADRFGLTDILKSANRRVGKSKLLVWQKNLSANSPAHLVLSARFER